MFGAICPERGAAAAVVLPTCNARVMQFHIDGSSTQLTPRAHAMLLLDRARRYTAEALAIPKNITPLLLPPRSPGLIPVENVWQCMRQNRLINRVFKTYDDIVGLCCETWTKLIGRP
ncbi:MAG: transposase [Alphaproteobacteria bacterium]